MNFFKVGHRVIPLSRAVPRRGLVDVVLDIGHRHAGKIIPRLVILLHVLGAEMVIFLEIPVLGRAMLAVFHTSRHVAMALSCGFAGGFAVIVFRGVGF